MPSERVQRCIDQILDEAEKAIATSDWTHARARAQEALNLDPGNADAMASIEAVDRAERFGTGTTGASPVAIAGTVARGFLMGAADIVPGVSGGTVALVLGIYERLLASIRAASSALGELARLNRPGAILWFRAVEWRFVVPLLFGIAAAILILADVVEAQLDDHPVEMAGLFLGLVLSAIGVVWRLLGRPDVPRILTMILVGGVVFALLGLSEGVTEDTVAQTETAPRWAFFLAGAVAIVAMILPGISGSLLLVILGMYGPVLEAVTDRDLVRVIVFVAGAAAGLALFSQLLHWALRHHYETVMAGLIGLMAGSLRVLWPWPDGLNGTGLGDPSGAVLPTVGLAILGAVAVLGISWLSKSAPGRAGLSAASPSR